MLMNLVSNAAEAQPAGGKLQYLLIINISTGRFEDVGTTFTLYFHTIREKETTKKDLIPIEKYLGNQEKILVIDDISDQREIAVTILSKLNYSVSAVSSGEEAVEYLRENSVDLLVIDMIMDPGIDGFETYKRIKKYTLNNERS